MYNDSPIEYKNYDRLNRTNFADSIATSIINLPQKSDSIVIGLMGGWGTGKSSLLNLVANGLKGYVNVLRFNPWNYYSQQMLFSSFFDELIGCLDLNSKFSALFQKYKYKIIGAGVEFANTVQPGFGLVSNFVPDSEFKTLDKLRDKLNDFFKHQPKTVVIIDDIDRLNPNEVKQIFQLVKSLADFPNLIYILAFDKNYVNYALKDWNMYDEKYSHTEEFIDKIIQVPLTIPKFGGEDFFNIFKYKFNKVLKNHNSNVKNFNIDKLYLLLSPFLKNIRDINRFCNALDFYLYSMDTEIWIHDFALVTALHIFENDIYDSIKKNQELLTGNLETFEDNIDLMDILGGNLKNYLNALFDNNLKHENSIKQILSDLFPKVNYIINASYTPKSEISIKKEHCGIMQKEFFDLYFTFDNSNSLSKSRIDSVINAANNNVDDLKTNLLLINEMDLLDSLIGQLINHGSSFEDVGIQNLIKTFNDNYKELCVDEPFKPLNSKISNVINLIYFLLNDKNLDDYSIFEMINKSKNNYFKTFLIWELNNVDLLCEELMSKLKNDISNYLSDYFEKKEFFEIEHIRSKIIFWKDFSSFEVTNKYISKLNDENLISFISEFVEHDVFKNENVMRYKYLENVVKLDSLVERLKLIKDSYHEFNSEQMEIVDLFLDNYSEE
ncbi:P-loop NTPase fold protein [uncultured Methanobrevibacter sp.]|uniref:P-loop NTPase fold protein n=1 Tax=uncultured Methanobrevibacter sp. TaxID=253161 RepID=UPI0025FED2C8|nr:P-loop NTPase fold protein [uncultured Methanobrevibacter sp.]